MDLHEPSYVYDIARTRVFDEASNKPVAICVPPAHGILLASAPLFRKGCSIVESILGREDISAEMRISIARDTLAGLFESVQRTEIRMLPEAR